MDTEDKRVSEVSEGILYEFLPSAFNAIIPPCKDPRKELTHDRCKLVASAALCVGSMMNIPPPFLEFLLCVPWQKFDELNDIAVDQDWMRRNLDIPQDLKRELINMPINSLLMPTVLEFIFSPTYKDSLPPLLKPPTEPVPRSHLENVAALLDGACSIHCAALRGNPSQIDHLLYSGADPTFRTASGDLPLQLVPVCGDAEPTSRDHICRCLNPKDQELWECRSSSSRLLIVRKCFSSIHLGLASWLMLMVLCLLNCLGIWGTEVDICKRSSVTRHVERQMKAKMKKACLESKRLMYEMRKEARMGEQYLEAARKVQWNEEKIRRSDVDLMEKAFLSFVHAVHFLQNLLMHNDGKDYAALPDVAPASLPKVTASDCQVAEDEQADLYCNWAESVLLKFQTCRCAGCAAVAMSAVRMAHVRCADLLAQSQRHHPHSTSTHQSVGNDLMHIIYSHICLLLDTDARRSATKASMWRADQCIKEWRRLQTKRFDFFQYDGGRVALLERWVKAAESDLLLAEALSGDLLEPSQTVEQIVEMTVVRGPKGMRYLQHQEALENVEILESALQTAKSASPYLQSLTEEVTQNAKDEIRAATKLKECLASKAAPLTSGMTEKLWEAISESERFPRLSDDVDAGRILYRQLSKRAEAIERLETIMQRARKPIDLDEKSDVDRQIIKDRIEALKVGIEEAKRAGINTEKARKLLRDLEALMTVVDAAHSLDGVMAKKPCGTATLKAALMKAEGCNAAGCQSNGLVSMSQFLVPRIRAARKRMEIERTVENLNRATVSYTTVDDLSKLESIILDARKLFDKLGTEASDQVAYNAARTLRGTLHDASKVRQQLHSSASALQKHQRKVDAVALETVIAQAQSCWSLIEDDAIKAQETLDHWKSIQAAEDRLNRGLNESETSCRLAKAIHDAGAVGVKTQSAKKVLKLMQNVEHAVEEIKNQKREHQSFEKIVEEAERGGVNSIFVAKAKGQFRNILASRAQVVLDAVLDTDTGVDINARCHQLKTVLQEALGIMQSPFLPSDVTDDNDPITHNCFWSSLLQTDPSSKQLQDLKERADRVNEELHSCESKILKRRIEEEKMRKAKELEQQRQLLLQQRIEAQQQEQERVRREHEEAARKEELLRQQQRQTMERRLQQSLEKQEKEKRSIHFRHRLIDPLNNEALTSSAAPTVRPYQPADDSMKEMENQVRRLLEDDGSTYPVEDSNLRVKGVLQQLDDPWGVQSTDEPEPFEVLDLTPVSNVPMEYVYVPRSDPFEALLAKKRMLDSMQAFENMNCRLADSRGMTNAMPWSRSASTGLVSRRSMPLDSSAPAFYPSASMELKDYKSINSFASDPMTPSKMHGWNGPSEEVPTERSRSTTCPFPGVGAGIPGSATPPVRSVSEGLTRFRQLSLSKTDREAYSMSNEF